MVVHSIAQMTAVVLGTASLAHTHPWIAVGVWGGKAAVMYAFKLAQQDFSCYVPISGPVGVLTSLVMRLVEQLAEVSDLGLFYMRHPESMWCVLWWFGKVFPWMLLARVLAHLLEHRDSRTVHKAGAVG
jgi:hypothetical protein